MGATCEPCSNDELYKSPPTVEPTPRLRPIKFSKSPSLQSNGSNESKGHISLSDTASAEEIYHQYHVNASTESNSNELGLNQTYSDSNKYSAHSNTIYEHETYNNDNLSPMNTVRLNESTAEILNAGIGAKHTDFSQMPSCRSWNTQRLMDVTGDLLVEMSKSVEIKQQQLIVFSGWLEKKQSSPPYAWLKRWVVAKDGNMLWSEWQMTVKQEVDEREMRRWNKCICLGYKGITVCEVKSKRKRRFKLITKQREYLFRAQDMNHRDLWMATLKQHIACAQEKALFRN